VLALLVVVLVVVPLVELYVIIQVGSSIGYGPTFLILIAISVVGAMLVKREGLGTLGRARAQLAEGQLPAGELADGVVIVIAGALLLTPGFVTDAIGALLLLPPVRMIARRRARTHRVARGGNVVYGRVVRVRNTADRPPGDRPAIHPPDPPDPPDRTGSSDDA
jgi:UPF0716 protein FxsA